MEQHIDCLIIFDHYEDPTVEKDQSEISEDQHKSQITRDMLEYKFYLNKPSEKAESKPKAKEEKKAPAFDPFADMMGGDSDSDDVDLMDFDFKAPPKKLEDMKKKEPEVQPAKESDKVVEGENRYV